MTDEIRCSRCSTLLAKRTPEGVEIKKKDLLVVVVGVALISCASCHRVTTIRSRFADAEGVHA